MMKLITTAMICVFTLFAAAQVASAQTIGFKLGMSSSKFDASEAGDDEQERLNSLAVGGFVRFGFAGLALQAEALGVTKGAEITGPTEDNGKLKIDYIEIPLTALFRFGNGPYVFGGGAVAFETGCQFEPDVGATENCDDEDSEIVPLKDTDFGVLVGAGFQFPIGPGAGLLEGRHTWGLTNLIDEDSGDSIKNRSFVFFAGYAIPIGRR
jgi:hypothetical protein